jgi:hypothetical protein
MNYDFFNSGILSIWKFRVPAAEGAEGCEDEHLGECPRECYGENDEWQGHASLG